MLKGVAWEQISGLVQRALMFGAGFAVARGIISVEQATLLVGALVTILGVLWSIKINTSAALTASVDGLATTKGVVTTNDVAGRAVADAVPSKTVATAGTLDAANIAKQNGGH
jgi:hypothetical protein